MVVWPAPRNRVDRRTCLSVRPAPAVQYGYYSVYGNFICAYTAHRDGGGRRTEDEKRGAGLGGGLRRGNNAVTRSISVFNALPLSRTAAPARGGRKKYTVRGHQSLR